MGVGVGATGQRRAQLRTARRPQWYGKPMRMRLPTVDVESRCDGYGGMRGSVDAAVVADG